MLLHNFNNILVEILIVGRKYTVYIYLINIYIQYLFCTFVENKIYFDKYDLDCFDFP